MAFRDRESMTDSDPHSLLFGPSDDDHFDHFEAPATTGGAHRPRPQPQPTYGRSVDFDDGHERRSRNRWFALALVIVLVLVVGVVIVGAVTLFKPSHDDYSGPGSGTVAVTVHSGDTLDTIGTTLVKAHVVKSVGAFTDAANNNSDAQNIQPGTYRLTMRIPAKTAILQLLDPARRVKGSDVLVTEGATTIDVDKRLTDPPCVGNQQPAAGKVCGLGIDPAAVKKVLTNVGALGLPTDYTVNGKAPLSAEGFLFPATYSYDKTMSVADLVQQMVSKFTDQARSTDFTAAAKALNITPYQELIIASIAQAEAKNPQDFPKVARVILNRLKARMPLQVDATSAYAAKLAGLDPTKTIYAEAKGPFNTYRNTGLPPTPIGNPGAEAMKGAANPAKGAWLYYVNGDAKGDLVFLTTEAQFERAALKCYQHHWGCAKP